MMKRLILAVVLLGCKTSPPSHNPIPTKEDMELTYGEKYPDWVPKGEKVKMKDGKVVMTADLARALTRDSEQRHKERFLGAIATAADMDQRNYSDEFNNEAAAAEVVADMKERGFIASYSQCTTYDREVDKMVVVPGWWTVKVSW